MKEPASAIGISLIIGCLTQSVILTASYGADRKPPPTRLPTAPGTPVLIPAGPNAEALARSAQKKVASADDAAANPTEAAPGANPPPNVDGNFLIGPAYVQAPALTVDPGVPQGRVPQFSMESTNSKFYPGIARKAFGIVDPNNPKTLIVETHAATYTRTITVYIPSQYVPGTPAPFIVTHDGPRLGNPDMSLPHVLDNLIAQHRLPAMLAIMIANGGGDAQGSERGLEYDTMSGRFAEFIESEVLPLVERNCGVKLTKDPEGRATMGGSSGGAAALEMAWYHPEWYHRVVVYSGTFVNQQWPFNPETPDGAWDFHEKLIPQSEPKPIRIWLEVGDRDLLNPNVMRDNMHDWVAANHRMAIMLKSKGYHYQYVFALNAGHVDRAVKNQTLPEALEWVWQGYAQTSEAR
jgi:enterochelin esterase family protein